MGPPPLKNGVENVSLFHVNSAVVVVKLAKLKLNWARIELNLTKYKINLTKYEREYHS